MKIAILKPGDKVICISDEIITIEHATGTVSLFRYQVDESQFHIHEFVELVSEDVEPDGCDNSDETFDVVHF